MIRIVSIFFLAVATNFAQVQLSGNLQSYIDSIISNMPDSVGGNEYQHPDVNEQNDWAEIIDSILAESYSAAHTLASSLEYRVIEYTDNSVSPNITYYILQMEQNGSNYWGTYIFNPNPERAQLVIQSPHPKKDYNTGKQGFYVFREVGARAFFLSGTSRCSSSSFSICDGTTSVCTGSSEDYRMSDQAHTSEGTFQITTERMLDNNSDLIFIQLHGFSKLSTDPYVIMSNGVRNDTPPIDYLSTLKDNLYAEDTTLTFKIAHIDTTWDRLLGTTNTQGRLINGSGDPCDDNATVNTGQFLHIEQERYKLRNDLAGWVKMANAISATFPEVPLPVELTTFTGKLIENNTVLLEWETATEVNNYGFDIERRSSSLTEWNNLGFVLGHGTTNSPKYYEYSDSELPNSDQASYRLKQIDNDGTYNYSKVVTVDLTNITSVNNEIVYEFSLEQNYPNPFNPSTTIKFTIPSSMKSETSNTILNVYDILGREVASLVNQKLQPGNYEVIFDGSNLTSGMYFYRISLGNEFNSVRKMMLVK